MGPLWAEPGAIAVVLAECYKSYYLPQKGKDFSPSGILYMFPDQKFTKS